MVLLRYNRRYSIPVGAPQSQMALRYFIRRSILPFLSALLLEDGRSSIPSSTSNRSASIWFQSRYLSPLSAPLSMDGLLCWICAHQSPSALLGLDFRPSISFCAPPSPSALPLPTSNPPWGTPPVLVTHLVFPRIRHIRLSNLILIHHSLTSIPTCCIFQTEPNDIGIWFYPLARAESFGNTRTAFSFVAPLMNRWFLR